jgi:hypothetical protein
MEDSAVKSFVPGDVVGKLSRTEVIERTGLRVLITGFLLRSIPTLPLERFRLLTCSIGGALTKNCELGVQSCMRPIHI